MYKPFWQVQAVEVFRLWGQQLANAITYAVTSCQGEHCASKHKSVSDVREYQVRFSKNRLELYAHESPQRTPFHILASHRI